MLDIDTPVHPFSQRVITVFSSTIKSFTSRNVTTYVEYLGWNTFANERYLQQLQTHFHEKYRDRPIGVIVCSCYSSPSLTYTIGLRDAVWPSTPIVVGALLDSASLPPNATGYTHRPRPDNTINLIKTVLPAVKKIVLVGDRIGSHNQWSRAGDDLAAIQPPVEYIDLTGLPMDDLRLSIADLPGDSAIVYLGITTDSTDKSLVPAEMAQVVAETANRPTFVGVETYFTAGGSVGGLLAQPQRLGEQVAHLALRILDGERADQIPLTPANLYAPVFDWRQLQRWGIDESQLPAGSEVRHREPTLWEQHRGAVLAVIAGFALLMTVIALLTGYLMESRRRSQAEGALTESEGRMALTASATKSGLWRVRGGDERFILTDTALEIFGLPNDRSYDLRDLAKAIHPEDRQLFLRTMFSAVRQNAPIDFRFRVVMPDGGARWVAAKAQAPERNGEQMHVIDGVFSDVTQIKELENERDQQRQELTHLTRHSIVNELSGSLAHELNQPLTAIMANAEAALDQLGRKDGDLAMVRESLQDIVEADVRAAEVINRVRRMIRKDGSRRELIDTEKLIESIHVLLRSEFVRRRISFRIESDGDIPLFPGDFVQLQQVLINVLMNAMEAIAPVAASPREVTLTVMRDGDRVKFIATDTGSGIASDMERKLFEPLATTKTHGLGLGLSICATIIRQHGGDIALTNNPDGGAIATLALPLQIQAEAAQ